MADLICIHSTGLAALNCIILATFRTRPYKSRFHSPFELNEKWSLWQFSSLLWIKWNSICLIIKRKTVTTIIFHWFNWNMMEYLFMYILVYWNSLEYVHWTYQVQNSPNAQSKNVNRLESIVNLRKCNKFKL